MTTEAAAAKYLDEHLKQVAGRKPAVYNPHNLPIESLPIIFGFNNGGSPGWYSAILLAEDGTFLGSHICSDEHYMEHDLGILENTRPDRHQDFVKHYPDGYRMEFVPSSEIRTHPILWPAIERAQTEKDSSPEEGI